MVYLDNASTTYPKPECVYKKLDEANRDLAFNSGRGSYKKAREVSNIIDNTREIISNWVNVESKNNVIFSTSSTDSLNRIIFGIEWNSGDNVYITPFEHNSIIRPLEEIRKRYQINIITIPFDVETWELDENIINIFAMNKPKCIFLSSKSNVTGYILPYKTIFELGKKYNSINILDASQSFGIDRKITKDFSDFIVFTGHKSLYSSFGVAGFIKTSEYPLKTQIYGGTGSDTLNPNMPDLLPSKYEAGSKNAVAIIGLNESCKWLEKNNIEEKEKELSNYLYEKLNKLPKVICYLPKNKNKCIGIISINVKGYLADDVGKILDDEYDICVRTGYHCAPLIHEFLDTKQYAGTVRISLSYFNSKGDIDLLISALETF